ncbi:unnamed protein product [Adineta ricciae]|uniref:Uncharacterized protein n=1 Tax=Adineta ricciae TaxID=249248 RepID=A0A814SI35_ADIRI|nr:unnamed protein product [Adineta ricciae]CAF1147645.1 unnamed protein product [Adineta ricciae]
MRPLGPRPYYIRSNGGFRPNSSRAYSNMAKIGKGAGILDLITDIIGNIFACFSADPHTEAILSCVCCVTVIFITVVAVGVGVGVGLRREGDDTSSTTVVSTVMTTISTTVRTSTTAMIHLVVKKIL